MFAEKDFEEGEVIYNELKMFGRKHCNQVFDSCENCMKVGGLFAEPKRRPTRSRPIR